MKFVAVTSCPTGIAHTYMAAESLEQSAKAAGHEIEVETQGAAGSTPLAPEVIAAADAVIFAADVEVRNRGRFAGKPLVQAGVKKAISDGPGLIAQAVTAAEEAALNPASVATVGAAAPGAGGGLATKVETGASTGTRIRQWLMTGVSYMIPFVAAGGILIALGRPLKALSDGLASWLNGLSGANLIVLGVILGLMMGFDLGGPVNKVAYTFATTGLATAATAAGGTTNLKVMAAVMAAGMTPPLGMALATTVRRNLFSEVERENGQAAWLLGASFITEGAIPFAAADPWRVILSSMVGSGITGGLVMLFGSTLRAPHGGIWVTPLIGAPLLYLLAIAIGTVVTAALVVSLKSTKSALATEEAVSETAAAAF